MHPPDETSASASGRRRVGALVRLRAAYRRLERSPLARLLELSAVQRLRARLQHPMEAPDVHEVLDLLAAGGVTAWVAGGWGADALLGRRTRSHHDLDLVVDRGDAQAAERLLRARGFAPIPGATRHVPGALLPERLSLQDARGREVDLHPVDAERWPDRPGVEAPFATGVIAGRSVACLSSALYGDRDRHPRERR